MPKVRGGGIPRRGRGHGSVVATELDTEASMAPQQVTLDYPKEEEKKTESRGMV